MTPIWRPSSTNERLGACPGQIAAHLLQILLHQIAGEAFDLRLLVDTIVMGHGGRQ
jgi:hypothetical protein